MRTHIAILAGTLALFIPVRDVAAQAPQTREGLNFALGVGGGSASVDCTGCQTTRQNGVVYFVNVGATINANVTLGGEVNRMAVSGKSEDDTYSSFMAIAHVYPVSESGLFLIAGGGLTSVSARSHTDLVDASSTGAGAQIGVGYDIRTGRNFSLTPFGAYVRGFAGKTRFDGLSLSNKMTPSYGFLGIRFTWH